LQPIRTASEISAHIKILPAKSLPLYQKIAQKATKLHLLGMTYEEIAKSLKIGKTTVSKAISSVRGTKCQSSPGFCHPGFCHPEERSDEGSKR